MASKFKKSRKDLPHSSLHSHSIAWSVVPMYLFAYMQVLMCSKPFLASTVTSGRSRNNLGGCDRIFLDVVRDNFAGCPGSCFTTMSPSTDSSRSDLTAGDCGRLEGFFGESEKLFVEELNRFRVSFGEGRGTTLC